MNCSKEDILRFARSELPWEEMERVLQHLEGCPDCAELLQLTARLQANRSAVSEALSEGKVRQFAVSENPMPISEGWSRFHPFSPYVVGMAALILVLLFGIPLLLRLSTPLGNIGQLATSERYPYQPLLLRGTPAQADRLFAEAIRHYESGHLPQARQSLEEFVHQNPKSGEGYFYLGVSCYLIGDLESANRYLKAGLEVRTVEPEERYRWYLAHIYLRLEERTAAVRELRHVLELEGEFQPQAKWLLEKLR